jgi:tripartite ATP-independent transporter DctM subunit
MSNEVLGLILFFSVFVVLMIGFPISFTLLFLSGVFGYIGLGDHAFGLFTFRAWETMKDTVLASVAMFTFMGFILESAGLMNRLFSAVQLLSGRLNGSLYFATILTAVLFAAATGIVGASVTIIGLLAAPAMEKAGYDQKLSAGAICSGGTLGILIPPSVMLVVMGPSLTVSVPRLFAGALIPGILLAVLYLAYTSIKVWRNPKMGPALSEEELNVSKAYLLRELVVGLIPIVTLIIMTLGSIVSGWATPTEGAALGCVGAVGVTAAHKKLTWAVFKDATYRTVTTTSMVMILILASSIMGGVFSALGAPGFIADTFVSWHIPPVVMVLAILILVFVLGGPLEWVPIVVIVLPIFQPVLVTMGVNMVWFSLLVAVTLQSAWLSPPVGMSAYYLKAVMPGWDLLDIYKGMAPFIFLQWVGILILYLFPSLILFLPNAIYGS